MPRSLAERAVRKIGRMVEAVSPKLWTEFAIALRTDAFETEHWLTPALAAGGVVVDVGANMGYLTYLMAKSARHVYAFEPNPLCLPRLRRLATAPNITVISYALSDREGDATMRFDPGMLGFSSMEPANRLDVDGLNATETATVGTRTLDSFEIADVSFLKIDVEGHEPAVVRGAMATIAASRPVLLIESELRHNPAAFGEVVALLSPLGYRPSYWTGDGLRPVEVCDLAALQDSSGRYVNNFLFLPPGRAL